MTTLFFCTFAPVGARLGAPAGSLNAAATFQSGGSPFVGARLGTPDGSLKAAATFQSVGAPKQRQKKSGRSGPDWLLMLMKLQRLHFRIRLFTCHQLTQCHIEYRRQEQTEQRHAQHPREHGNSGYTANFRTGTFT